MSNHHHLIFLLYFTGSTPADELSILKHQVTLLKLQLQYERHKCELHVLRNRRLVGKVHKAQMFIDEANALVRNIYYQNGSLHVLLTSRLSSETWNVRNETLNGKFKTLTWNFVKFLESSLKLPFFTYFFDLFCKPATNTEVEK